MILYVGNLHYNMTERALGDLFSSHGSVTKVNLISDHFTRQSKCFGYVEMKHNSEGASAIDALHGTRINKQPLIVKKARPRDQRDSLPW